MFDRHSSDHHGSKLPSCSCLKRKSKGSTAWLTQRGTPLSVAFDKRFKWNNGIKKKSINCVTDRENINLSVCTYVVDRAIVTAQ